MGMDWCYCTRGNGRFEHSNLVIFENDLMDVGCYSHTIKFIKHHASLPWCIDSVCVPERETLLNAPNFVDTLKSPFDAIEFLGQF